MGWKRPLASDGLREGRYEPVRGSADGRPDDAARSDRRNSERSRGSRYSRCRPQRHRPQ